MAFFGILANLYRISQCLLPLPPAAAGGLQGGGMYLQPHLMWTLWQVPAQEPPACPRQGGRRQLGGRGSQMHLRRPLPHTKHKLQPPETFSGAAGVGSHLHTPWLNKPRASPGPWVHVPMDQPRDSWRGAQEKLSNQSSRKSPQGYT